MEVYSENLVVTANSFSVELKILCDTRSDFFLVNQFVPDVTFE